jgi:hypothetical protein
MHRLYHLRHYSYGQQINTTLLQKTYLFLRRQCLVGTLLELPLSITCKSSFLFFIFCITSQKLGQTILVPFWHQRLHTCHFSVILSILGWYGGWHQIILIAFQCTIMAPCSHALKFMMYVTIWPNYCESFKLKELDLYFHNLNPLTRQRPHSGRRTDWNCSILIQIGQFSSTKISLSSWASWLSFVRFGSSKKVIMIFRKTTELVYVKFHS